MSNTVSEKILSDIYREFIRRGPGSVATDSRSIASGDIFFALRGEHLDGNIYASSALDRGAALAVVDSRYAASPEGKSVSGDGRYVVVEDTLAALQELASRYRRELGIPIIALTGSNGKTTTKELLAKVLGAGFRVGATRGNFNNHIGVPLTLLSFDRGTEIGIVEMGANHRGEIASLCRIARPDFGLITNIGKAHLEGFGSEEGVRRAKGELFDYLASSGGKAFYRADDPVLGDMVRERGGMDSGCKKLDAVPYTLEGLSVEQSDSPAAGLTICAGGEKVTTHMIGDYNLNNIAAALAVGDYFGIGRADALKAVASYIPDNNRSQRVVTTRNTLYMDAYNANPSSMSAAIANFASMAVPSKVLIIGDMRELGEHSLREHGQIIDRITRAGFRDVYTVGEFFGRSAAGSPFLSFRDVAALIEYLQENPVSDCHILIKGSRGIELEKAAELL